MFDKDIQRVGNVVFNKGGNRRDEESWLRLKDHMHDLENRLDKINKIIFAQGLSLGSKDYFTGRALCVEALR